MKINRILVPPLVSSSLSICYGIICSDMSSFHDSSTLLAGALCIVLLAILGT